MYQNQFIFSRERRLFGRQCLFQDRNELMVSVHPSGRLRLKYILRDPAVHPTQLSDQMALSIMETENVTHDQHGMYHYEGGWPREVNINDEEQTVRHRKKVEREDSWGEQVTDIIRSMMNVAEQNNAINIYQNFFADLSPELGQDLRQRFTARVVNVFHDLWVPPRQMNVVDWMPNNEKQFMAQFTNQYRLRPDGEKLVPGDAWNGGENGFYIWEVNNPLKPKLFYDSNEVVSRAKICPKDENNLAGGTWSGKVCIWSTFKSGPPLRICPLETAHRENTKALCWVHSKSNTEFYTGSLDGSIKYWDTRDLMMPVHELLLEPMPQERQSRQNSHGVMVLEFEYTIPVRFIIGSDMGCVFVGNRKGMTPQETLLAHYQLFAGPVCSINRNPFFVKNFLVTGDWRARVWSEESKDGPSTMYFRKKTQIVCGAWSTGRCSLFVTGDKKGVVDFWDLLLHQRLPVCSINFGSPIKDVVFRPEGSLLAIALENGDTQILVLDDAMKSGTGKEKALIAAMFEREIMRSKILEARVEEMKLKRRTQMLAEEERARNAGEVAELDLELDPDNPDQFVQLIEGDDQFRLAIADFQEMLLNVERKRSKRNMIMERTAFEQWYLEESREHEPSVGSQDTVNPEETKKKAKEAPEGGKTK
ncbi:dynein intermediate chain 3, ciliary [Drosophila obscura]|uniref:dynein intermediate chain 3, ciliary n=1 Tax=Drosophila obscura TaxID=7282 RepID=UPI000B9FE6C9|nr:dynein intermediate chain 3, ciliary [Drosophila obscura]